MNRFHEIIDHYGLKLMEVGVNHLRIFSEGRKLFDYYTRVRDKFCSKERELV